jgi:hydroxymethylglutaryl-CoA lyase
MAVPSIAFVEVGPRDGLQNERETIATGDKIKRIEVTSFVNPKRVPQMADAEAVCAALPDRADVTFVGLVMNVRGAERAIATGRIDQLGAVAVATDRFAIANQGQTSDESVETARTIIAMARAAGLTGQATIAAAFGCPFEGEVGEARVVAMARRLAEAGPVEIALADTIGVGNPAHVARLVARVRFIFTTPAIPGLPMYGQRWRPARASLMLRSVGLAAAPLHPARRAMCRVKM